MKKQKKYRKVVNSIIEKETLGVAIFFLLMFSAGYFSASDGALTNLGSFIWFPIAELVVIILLYILSRDVYWEEITE